jgi:hypothetical protein
MLLQAGTGWDGGTASPLSFRQDAASPTYVDQVSSADNALWLQNEPEVNGSSPASSPVRDGIRAPIANLVVYASEHRHTCQAQDPGPPIVAVTSEQIPGKQKFAPWN